ncbi:hypothetical protein [Burkholderia territorii]|uniref:hypothetical protein n=1 Tax=Burkholderia territorii TaxID=1503055 RepID=UPI0012DA14BF|nr:hypothetical protein [Burkholderia territorii]
MIEHKLVRLAVVIGAAVWLARVILSRSERDKLDAAVRMLERVHKMPDGNARN